MAIRDRMLVTDASRVNILHITCHSAQGPDLLTLSLPGDLQPGTEEELVEMVLVDENEDARIERIGRGKLECVILNSCNNLAIASKLSGSGVPYVVCWKGPVSLSTCKVWSDSFYKALAQNPSQYINAFEQGLKAIADFPQAKSQVGDQVDLYWNDPIKGSNLNPECVDVAGMARSDVLGKDKGQWSCRFSAEEGVDLGHFYYPYAYDNDRNDHRPLLQKLSCQAGWKEREALDDLGLVTVRDDGTDKMVMFKLGTAERIKINNRGYITMPGFLQIGPWADMNGVDFDQQYCEFWQTRVPNEVRTRIDDFPRDSPGLFDQLNSVESKINRAIGCLSRCKAIRGLATIEFERGGGTRNKTHDDIVEAIGQCIKTLGICLQSVQEEKKNIPWPIPATPSVSGLTDVPMEQSEDSSGDEEMKDDDMMETDEVDMARYFQRLRFGNNFA